MNHRQPTLAVFASRGFFGAAIALVAASPLVAGVWGPAGWALWTSLAMLALGMTGVALAYTGLRMALASYVIRNTALRADLNEARGAATAAAEASDGRCAALRAETDRLRADSAAQLAALTARCGSLETELAGARREAAEALAGATASAALDRHERIIAAMLTFANECVHEKERYRKGLLRLSVANKREELHHRLSSSDIDTDTANLYRHFDAAFIALYPEFIRRFNDRLCPADRLTLRPDGTMPTELRAIALMRLGITDSKTVAKLLNISVATVYNYRSRYKARVAPEGSLEETLREL